MHTSQLRNAPRTAPVLLGIFLSSLLVSVGHAHEPTLASFLGARNLSQRTNSKSVIRVNGPTSSLQLDIRDKASGKPLFALIRLTDVESGKRLQANELIERPNHWYVVSPRQTIDVPKRNWDLEVVHGIETKLVKRRVNLTNQKSLRLKLSLERFYDAKAKGITGGNTHLHLSKMSMQACIDYLRRVPRADDLDVLFVSHLLRKDDDKTYITNRLAPGDFHRLSTDGLLVGNGEEHRHNFGPGGQGYGHVMLLNIKRLIEPVSIGPGIMKSGTDGIPLQRGIKEAHRQGATVVWCHNKFGFEDVPNWLSGLVHAQNIFDGGSQGYYNETFYRYLNFGLRVPFSTGTDWFIYDFSRVYVPTPDRLSVVSWLEQLQKGRSFITNGPLLEFEVNGRPSGSDIQLKAGEKVKVRAAARSRSSFRSLQVIHNGKVVHQTKAKAQDGYFDATLEFPISVERSGWVAVRVPPENDNNILGKRIYAHTSPVYLSVAGKAIHNLQIAQGMLEEIEANLKEMQEKGKFANAEERNEVLKVHTKAITQLKEYISQVR